MLQDRHTLGHAAGQAYNRTCCRTDILQDTVRDVLQDSLRIAVRACDAVTYARTEHSVMLRGRGVLSVLGLGLKTLSPLNHRLLGELH